MRTLVSKFSSSSELSTIQYLASPFDIVDSDLSPGGLVTLALASGKLLLYTSACFTAGSNTLTHRHQCETK